MDTYLTISKFSEGIYKEKGSKFLAFAFPIKSEDDVKERLSELRKKFHDARHHCYAYRFDPENEQYRTNDDGEPSNSAGKPIYGQILANELQNVLIVVVRYFGGVKLGVGGLINAYRTAAAEAIKENEIIEKKITYVYKINFDYSAMNDVMKILKDYDLDQQDQVFELKCSLKFSVRKSIASEVKEKLESIDTSTVSYLLTT